MLAHEPLRLPPHIEDELTDLENLLDEVGCRHLLRLRGFMLALQRELEQARHEAAVLAAERIARWPRPTDADVARGEELAREHGWE